MTHRSTHSAFRAHPYADAPDTSAAFRRIAELGAGPERDGLRQEIVCAWIPMAERLARRYRSRGEPLEDLEQVAQLGLVKAVLRYDPQLGSAFVSYAVPTIVGELKRHFRDHLWGVHVPRRAQELRNRVRVALRDLDNSPGNPAASVAEIAAHTGMTEREVRAGLEAIDSFATLSLDAALAGSPDGYALADTLGLVDPGFDRIVNRESLRPRLQALPERERRILYLRFFCQMTQSGIAQELGLSQMHISRLIKDTCDRLRDQVLADAV